MKMHYDLKNDIEESINSENDDDKRKLFTINQNWKSILDALKEIAINEEKNLLKNVGDFIIKK
jgi:hypothetical protein